MVSVQNRPVHNRPLETGNEVNTIILLPWKGPEVKIEAVITLEVIRTKNTILLCTILRS